MATTPDSERPRTVVLGLGNPLMGDDGFGLAVLARLQGDWELPPSVELVDGGTWGMNLLPLIEDAEEVILIDAIRTGAPPGTLVEIEGDRLPKYLAHKLSPHQIDLKEVLGVAMLRGTLPGRLVAIGAESGRLELSTMLSPVLEDRVDDVARAVANRLTKWGHRGCRPLTAAHA
jgi:hydrogenase maturation protease